MDDFSTNHRPIGDRSQVRKSLIIVLAWLVARRLFTGQASILVRRGNDHTFDDHSPRLSPPVMPSPSSDEGPRGSAVVIVVMLIFVLMLGFAGWHEYQLASPDLPRLAFSGEIFVAVPRAEAVEVSVRSLCSRTGKVPFAVDRELFCTEEELEVTLDIKLGKISRCTSFQVFFKGDARLSVTRKNDGDRVHESPGEIEFRGYGCSKNRDGYVYASWVGRMAQPMIRRSGYTTVARAPDVGILTFNHHRPRLPSPSLRITWDLGTVPEDYNVEWATAGRLRPETLMWGADEKQIAISGALGAKEGSGPYVRIVSASEKLAADRALFWAGILAGFAVSILIWTGELVLERLRRTRRHPRQEEVAGR